MTDQKAFTGALQKNKALVGLELIIICALIMSHLPWKNGVSCVNRQSASLYVRSGRIEPSEPVLRIEAGNHPLLCTQGSR